MPSNLKSNLALLKLKDIIITKKKIKLIHKILYNSTFKFRFSIRYFDIDNIFKF